jgi:LAO/AO transport system kinase
MRAKAPSPRQNPDQGILRGDRVALGRAITLAESTKTTDRVRAEKLIERLFPRTGRSIRIGITGAPGVGKSTFIDIFGKHLTALGHRVAVLTIDPSSQKTRGSILGDKTRMEELSRDPLAFIRPTASGTTTGGVAGATRESILLCEAAGFEIIIVETVGVGQSEVAVRGMVDFFLLLMLAGAGDELQGIKKGIMEMADGIAITKADGENIGRARRAQADFQHALRLFQPEESGWTPRVLSTSAMAKTGIGEVWEMIESFRKKTTANNFFERQRRQQLLSWFHSAVEQGVKRKMLTLTGPRIAVMEKKVLAGKLTPAAAASTLLARPRQQK